ncbi:hypothetical protein FACS1894172_12750 [Spirochaetia bacterium]|nr:hypothetical protein FACS1894172_12750 [Spirochaetia bacterium]
MGGIDILKQQVENQDAEGAVTDERIGNRTITAAETDTLTVTGKVTALLSSLAGFATRIKIQLTALQTTVSDSISNFSMVQR